MDNVKLLEKLETDKNNLFTEISKIIIGQESIINNLFIALLCKGHVLLEGVPGLAKTLLIKTLANVLDLKFNRIQFTPDLMPSDITGTEIIDEIEGKRQFKFFKGPIFANIILADEINRTPPKTQSALLEAMQEYKLTAGGKNYKLDEPFFVLATQNPIEQEGTYPLPEAELDRFMFNLMIHYPSIKEEIKIIKSATSEDLPNIKPLISSKEILEYQELVRNTPVADNVIEYAVNFVNSTRKTSNDNLPKPTKDWIEWGAGPRASISLILGAKAKALIEGRSTPDIDDVNSMINPVLRHRIIPNFNSEADGISRDDILSELIKSIK